MKDEQERRAQQREQYDRIFNVAPVMQIQMSEPSMKQKLFGSLARA